VSNLVVVTSPTLDGVRRAPGRPDEDLVLGSGRRLFADGGPLARLRLVDRVTTTGVLVATYPPTQPTAGTST
jgi:hypothetical protein